MKSNPFPEGSKAWHLAEEIISRSVANDWYNAVGEWSLHKVIHEDDDQTCLCTHHPIRELCILVNRRNGEHVTVGNCCVTKFCDADAGQYIKAIQRLEDDGPVRTLDDLKAKPINEETLRYARRAGWINDWEFKFYLDTRRKRKLTDAQEAKRAQVNDKIARAIKRFGISLSGMPAPKPSGGPTFSLKGSAEVSQYLAKKGNL